MTLRRTLFLIKANQSFFAIVLSVFVIFYNVVSGGAPAPINIVYVAIVFSKYLFTGYVRSLELAIAVGLISLFAVPAALSIAASDGEYVVLLAVALLFMELVRSASLLLNRRLSNPRPRDREFNVFLWLLLLTIVVTGWHLRVGLNSISNVFLFYAPYAASLVLLDRSLDILSKRKIYLIIAAYFILILYYSIFFWSGFGRLVISAYIMMPILVVNQHRDIGLRVWQLTFVIPFALVGAFVMRFQESDLKRLMEDSWSSHLTLTREMLDTVSFREPKGVSEYFEQYALLFFQWVPRSVWPTKPVGVGLSFVDDWIGREGFDIGHSIALGFIGETLWYLGPYFILGLALIFITIIMLRLLAATLDKGGYALLAIVDSFLPSFLWGGMASYGSRFWFFFIPTVFTLYTLRLRIHPKRRFGQ